MSESPLHREFQVPPSPVLVQCALVGLAVGLATAGVMVAEQTAQVPSAWRAGLLAALWFWGLAAVFLGPDLRGMGQQRWLAPLATALSGALLGGLAALAVGTEHASVPALLALALALAGAIFLLQTAPRRAGGLAQFYSSSAILFGLAALLAALFYGLMLLAAELAGAVGLGGLGRFLTTTPWGSVVPLVTAGAFFVGVLRVLPFATGLTRSLSGALALLAPVAGALLVLTALVLLLAAVGGWERLYTGLLSSGLYLGLAGASTLLTVLATRHDQQLPEALSRFLRHSLLFLPLFPALALYGLWVRVGQHGLTDNRVLAVATALWLLAVGVGLASTRLRPPLAGSEGVWRVAVLAAAALALPLTLPALSPHALTVRSQLARLSEPGAPPAQVSSAVYALQGRGGVLEGLVPTELPQPARDMVALYQQRPEEFHRQHPGPQHPGLPVTFRLRALPQSAPLPAGAEEAVRGQSGIVSHLCAVPDATCELRAFALAEAGGTLLLLPSAHDLQYGQWLRLGAGGEVREHGHFGPVLVLQLPHQNANIAHPGGDAARNALEEGVFRQGVRPETVTATAYRFGPYRVFLNRGL